MHWYIALFLSALLQVFTRATQQLNVVHFKWARIPLVSYLMAATQYVIIAFIAIQAYSNTDPLMIGVSIFLLGTGGWMGAFLAMYLHKRLEK